jgi:MFS family permease
VARRASTKPAREPFPKGYGVIWTTVAVDLIGFGIILPILPRYAEQFNASPTTIGVLSASFSMAQLVFAPLFGRLSDRIGRKPVILISLFGTALGSFITGAAGALWVLFLGRIIDGASGASVSVAQAAVSDVASPRRRAALMGMLGAAFGVGFVVGPIIGSIGALYGPHVPFYLAAAIAFVNGLVAIKRLPETAPAHAGERAVAAGDAESPGVNAAARAEGEALQSLPALDGPGLADTGHLAGPSSLAPGTTATSVDKAAIVRLITVSFVGLVAFAGFEATFALLVERRLGLTLSSTAALFAGIGLVLVAVQGGLVGPVTQRLGERTTLLVGLGGNAIGLGLLSIDAGWAVLVPALLALVVGQGLLTPTLSSALAGRAGSARGQWLGWQQSAGGAARVIGPILAGALFQHVGVGAPYAVGAVLALVALGLVPASGVARQDADPVATVQ